VADHGGVARLVAVMDTLREQCPWDRRQTHRSLVPYLVEETCEVVEAVEAGDRAALREELGDLLLQVVFHARIASEDGGFDLDDVADGIADKLVARHPHVFSEGGRPPSDPPNDARAADQVPEDLHGLWERRKAVEKGRTSALDGIPEQLSALSRAAKIIARSRSHRVPLDLPADPIDANELGAAVLALAARGQRSGIDAEQAVRDAVRGLEGQVKDLESAARRG
jgi:XTP/dITP diphosphohydrolase